MSKGLERPRNAIKKGLPVSALGGQLQNFQQLFVFWEREIRGFFCALITFVSPNENKKCNKGTFAI